MILTGDLQRKGKKFILTGLDQQLTPWTSDPIIQVHKFTNAYRAADRVSQYLIKM
jgi:hypothetical protein